MNVIRIKIYLCVTLFPMSIVMDDFDCPISDIVKLDYRTAEVFKKYQLSFCCKGSVSLKSACEAKGIDFEFISNELKEATRNLILPNNLSFRRMGNWFFDRFHYQHSSCLYLSSNTVSLFEFGIFCHGSSDQIPRIGPNYGTVHKTDRNPDHS